MISPIPPRATRREWIGLAVIALPCLLYSMDLTVLNLALPSLTVQLSPTAAQQLWIVDIYGFLVAGALITMGTLGDRIGRRRLLMLGAAAFGAASVLAALARSAQALILARAVLGLAGATLAPSTLSLIRNMFQDPRQRTVAIGVWISSYSAGGAIGPVLGGILLEHFHWGAVFLISVPVMLLLLVVGPVLLPEYRDPKAGRIDIASAGLSLFAVLAVIFGLKRIAESGVGAVALLSIAAGLLVGYGFVRRQRGLADPLIDLALFRKPAFTAALATYTLGTFVMFGPFLFIAQYFQLVLGFSPLKAGLWMMPFPAGFILGSMLTPLVVRRARPAAVMAGGLAAAAAGFMLLTQPGWGMAVFVAGAFLMAVGTAPVFTLATDLIVTAAPPERAGAASAISETCSEFGGALGIALLGSLGAAIYRLGMAVPLPTALSAPALEASRATLGGAIGAAAHLPGPAAAELVGAAHGAFIHAWRVVGSVSAATAVAAGVLAVLLLWDVRPHDGSV